MIFRRTYEIQYVRNLDGEDIETVFLSFNKALQHLRHLIAHEQPAELHRIENMESTLLKETIYCSRQKRIIEI